MYDMMRRLTGFLETPFLTFVCESTCHARPQRAGPASRAKIGATEMLSMTKGSRRKQVVALEFLLMNNWIPIPRSMSILSSAMQETQLTDSYSPVVAPTRAEQRPRGLLQYHFLRPEY